MVSTAMAVLPVWRSPKISSLCPRPMGISASTTFSPVCKGTVTAERSIIAVAIRSIGKRWSDAMAFFPSIGSPNGFITLPINALPTGISITRPVRSTSSPVFINESSPSNTAPISCSSMLKAIPYKSPGNFNNSSNPALGRPETLTTPEDTLLTIPTSRGQRQKWCFSRPLTNWSNVRSMKSLSLFRPISSFF